MKLFLRSVAVIAVLAVTVYAVLQLSPWPSALLIRFAFDRGGDAASAALEKHIPPEIAARFNLQYDTTDSDAFLDVFYPADYAPPLTQEYQFNLDTEAGRLALERSVAFLNGR